MVESSFFLTCPPLLPHKLSRDRPCRIGRGPECDLVLAHGAVSRNHARVWWSEDAYQIEDEGALNGTHLNGQRIQRAALRHGDRLRIGPFHLKFVENRLPELEQPDQGHDTMMLTPTISETVPAAVAGRLTELDLTEVLQLLGMSRKTGTLKVQGAGRDGFLILENGEIVHAESGGARGEAAVFELIRLKDGGFQFIAETNFAARTIQRSTLYLLMEGCRLVDESRREGPRGPDPSLSH